MKPIPDGWQRFTPGAFYQEPGKMIDWLCEAFGFEIRLRVEGEGGQVVHGEVVYGDGLFMVSPEGYGPKARFGTDFKSPLNAHCNTQNMMVYVDDVDAHCAHARAKGATIVDEPSNHDYGEDYWMDRSYGASDPEGHLWWFTQRMRTGGK